MNRKSAVNIIRESFRAIAGVLLLGAALLTGGCGNQAQAENERRNKSAVLPGTIRIAPEIAGTWHRRPGVGVSEYARFAENLGDFETYEISPNGHVRRTNLIAARVYDCPTEDLAVSEGAIVVESPSALNITLDIGTLRHREGCAPEKNYVSQTKATTGDYRWKLGKTEDGADELCLTAANTGTICYRRD